MPAPIRRPAPPGHVRSLPSPTALLSSQPVSEITSAELEQCMHAVESSSWRPSLPVMLTYLTSGPPSDWLLGMSAARHGLPLVLAGHGRRWDGWTGRLPGLGRAVRMIAHLTRGQPSSAIIVTDGSDTMVVNPLAASMQALQSAQDIYSSPNKVLVGAECMSAPQCYIGMYATDREHQACLTSSQACFANAGAYLGSPSALLRAWHAVSDIAATGKGRELNDDQFGLHKLYLAQRQRNVSVRVDGASSIFLSLRECVRARIGKRKRTKVCNYGSYDPLRHVQRDTSPVGLVFGVPGQAVQRPLLAHANGYGNTTHERFQQLQRALNGASAAVSVAQSLVRWRAQPVLLVDAATSRPGQVCEVVTLGTLLHGRGSRRAVNR